MRLKKYTGEVTYQFPNGVFATPEKMLSKYPAINTFTHVIITDDMEQVCLSVENLSAMRMRFGIDSSLTEDEAIAAIEEIMNTPVEESTEASAEERTAAALEAIAAGQTTENAAAVDALLTGEE